jgi:hypothetical protein
MVQRFAVQAEQQRAAIEMARMSGNAFHILARRFGTSALLVSPYTGASYRDTHESPRRETKASGYVDISGNILIKFDVYRYNYMIYPPRSVRVREEVPGGPDHEG